MARRAGAIALSCAWIVASFASLTHAQQGSPTRRHNSEVTARATEEPPVELAVAAVLPPEEAALADAQVAGDGAHALEGEGALPADASADADMTLRLGDIRLRPRAEVRARLELRGRWLDAPEDRATVTTRVRLGMEARWDVVRVVIDLQDARDMGVSSASGATTGVLQGFLELGDGRSFARVGRQMIDVGAGRLVGSLNWASAARSFDAVRVRGALDDEIYDVFFAVIAAPRQVHGERVVDSEGDYLGGLTVEWVCPLVRLGADLLVRHDGPHEQQLERHRDVAALSLRASGDVAAARYHVELIGEAGSEGFLAAAAIAEGHVRLSVDWRPELGLGLTYGSGRGPGSAADELENFFPSNHLIYGLADLLGLRNQAQIFVQATITPLASMLSAWVAARLFALPEPGGRWSSAGGATVGANETNREGVLGGEVDIEARWRPTVGVDVWAGYALFLPAAGARALGRDEPMHFGYVMAGARLPD